jgi:peptidoglycan/LPS O-acetylase OafA/YrhL
MGKMGEDPLRFLLWGLPSAALVYGALSLEKHFTRAGLLVALGDASYSIYLVHFIIYKAVHLWWPIAAYAQVSLGYLVHLFVEKPLLKARFLARVNPDRASGDITARAVADPDRVDV